MIPGVSCSTCAFFSRPPYRAHGDRDVGQCRAHAPLLNMKGEKPRSIWPLVDGDAWCGDHSTPQEA